MIVKGILLFGRDGFRGFAYDVGLVIGRVDIPWWAEGIEEVACEPGGEFEAVESVGRYDELVGCWVVRFFIA